MNSVIIGNKYISLNAISYAENKNDGLRLYFKDNKIPLFLFWDDEVKILWKKLTEVSDCYFDVEKE